jgi:hypothetical protein
MKLYPHYKQIVVTKSNASPYIYILFYSKFDPQRYQALGSPRDLDNTGFDKYLFVPYDCPLKAGGIGKKNVLYIDKGSCVTPKGYATLLDTVYWKDNNPAFKLLEYTPPPVTVKVNK